jgi:hypothetical protein
MHFKDLLWSRLSYDLCLYYKGFVGFIELNRCFGTNRLPDTDHVATRSTPVYLEDILLNTQTHTHTIFGKWFGVDGAVNKEARLRNLY